MSATAYADDFVDLSGWTASGMAVASGEVKASVDNSTVGKLTRTHESGIPPQNNTVTVRVGFDFVVDTSMTANTQVSVSLLDAASSIGNGVYIKQGVGIVSAKYLTTPGFTATTTLLAWASLVNGGRYHIEWTVNTTNFYAFYSLYDPSGNLVGTRSFVNDGAVDWFHSIKLVIESNSTKTTVSRLAIDPSLTGSATTGKYLTNTAKYTYFEPLDGMAVDYYIPGGGNISRLANFFHGAGQAIVFLELTTLVTGASVVNQLLKAGVMVAAPAIPVNSGGGDSWGNDYGAASVVEAIRYGRVLIGNTNAPLIFIAYSMGMLTAGRLLGYDGVRNVIGLYCLRGCSDIADLEQNGGFSSQIDTAWGISHQASYAAAQVTLARGNPLGLLGTNPAAFAGVQIFMDYSTTGDTTVPQVTNCVAFEALLTAKNIVHKKSFKTFATHTETSTVGDATAFVSQLLGSSGGGRQCGPMALML